MNRPRKTGEDKKQALIDGLAAARRSVLAAIQSLPEDCVDEVFLGEWSVKDLLAHLVGWDFTNLQTVQEIRDGQYPSFFQYYDKDWQSYNRSLVQQYRRESLPALLAVAAESHRRLISLVQGLEAQAVLAGKATRLNGRTMTIRNFLLSEASDERQHAEQVVTFYSEILSRKAAKYARGINE